jgi:hypothetical protein
MTPSEIINTTYDVLEIQDHGHLHNQTTYLVTQWIPEILTQEQIGTCTKEGQPPRRSGGRAQASHPALWGGTGSKSHGAPCRGRAFLRGPRPSRVRRVQEETNEARKALRKRVHDKWRRKKLYNVNHRTVPPRPVQSGRIPSLPIPTSHTVPDTEKRLRTLLL